MNKLKKLYEITKGMKGVEVFEGIAQLSIQKDDTELFFWNNEFVKDRNAHTMSSNYQVKVNSEMGAYSHSGNVSFSRKSGSSMKHPHFKGHHGHHKHLWSGLTTMLKVLNEIETKELEDGSSIFTYAVDEFPADWIENIRKAHSKDRFKENPHMKHMEMLSKIEPTSLNLVVTVSSDHKVEKIEGEFTATYLEAPIKGNGFIVLK